MKRFLFFTLSLLVASSIFAHTITPGCHANGRFKYTCSDFSNGSRQYVKIHINTGLWGNGTTDTIFNIHPSYAFEVYIPQATASLAVTVTFTNVNASGNNPGEIHTVTTTNCTSLPLTYGNFKVTKLPNNMARVTFTVYNVENISHINIQVSVDNKIYTTRAVVFPSEGMQEKQYSVDIKLE